MHKWEKKKGTFNLKIECIEKDREKIKQAAKLLHAGELVAFPTETVYGLGANALSTEAVKKIFAVKGRPADNPLIVHIADASEMKEICRAVPSAAYTLAEKFWPGPLTLVLKGQEKISPLVRAGLATVALRIPDHPVALALLEESRIPVAAPSANVSGLPSPTRASHVLKDMAGKIAALLDGGSCRVGVESTVLDLTGDIPRILRPGGVSMADLKKIIPAVEDGSKQNLKEDLTPASPGMKYRHYAPKAPLFLFEGVEGPMRSKLLEEAFRLKKQGKKVGLLLSSPLDDKRDVGFAYNIDGKENPRRAALNLFHYLRLLDENQVDVILAEGMPEEGIGEAVMNRLRKAAGENIIVLV